jgi:GTP-binding protein Era
MTRAGFVTLVGRPNAGKSTLLNHLVGTKLAIVSPKPQSTRDRVVGILIHADTQMVLFDTPGLLEPRYDLHRSMRRAALEAIFRRLSSERRSPRSPDSRCRHGRRC